MLLNYKLFSKIYYFILLLLLIIMSGTTGYMLIDGGNVTTASYMSNTLPIPSDKIDIAVCTALAGEMLGMQCLFMDGGSGAKNTVSEQMIKQVKASVDLPVIVGGGIRTPHQARAIWDAGADVVVVGTVIEENVAFLKDFR